MILIKLFTLLSIFTVVFVHYFRPITAITQDLGRHILTGMIIVKTYTVPKTNLFSYTHPNYPFVNHHWLSEVMYYLLFQIGGFNTLLILHTIVICAAFFLLFFYSSKTYSFVASTLVALIYLPLLFTRTDVRPEIFSFLFLSVFLVILSEQRKRHTRWIFILPVIELVWVNMHIYFIVGIAVLGLFLLDAAVSERKKFFAIGRIRTLLIVLTISTFSTLINPNGLKGALYPLTVFQNYGYSIEENQTIFFLWQYFQRSTVPLFVVSACFLFLSLTLAFKKTKPIDWFLGLFFTYLAASAIRNVPLFALAAFLPFTQSLTRILEAISYKTHKKTKTISPLLKSSLSIIFACVFLWQAYDFARQSEVGFGVEPGPQYGADFFLQRKLKGPIFNNFDIGSYLEYRLYPKEKVFVDGRPEAYPARFFQAIYIPMQNEKKIFLLQDKKYSFNTIFFSHTDQTPWAGEFLKAIITNPEWRMVYLDYYVVIFVKNTKDNQKLIQQFATDKNSFHISSLNAKNIKHLGYLTRFFQTVGWKNKELEAYQLMLNIEPTLCPALYKTATILLEKQSPLASVYINRFNHACQ